MKPIYALGHFLGNSVHQLFFRGDVSGVENIPEAGPFILAANHVSFLDPLLLGAKIPREIHYLARKTLFKKGFRGWVLRRVNAIPVDLENESDVGAIRQVLALLREGGAILLFPEGTRTSNGRLQAAKAGVGLIACKAGVPVVPARIFGGFDAFGRHLRHPRFFTPVNVGFGPVLSPPEFDQGGRGKNRYQAASEAIMKAIAALRPPGG